MINLNAFEKPYDNIRPKAFFYARKYQMLKDILTKKHGKTIYPAWNRNDFLRNRNTVSFNADYNELKILLPWILLLSMALISILVAVM